MKVTIYGQYKGFPVSIPVDIPAHKNSSALWQIAVERVIRLGIEPTDQPCVCCTVKCAGRAQSKPSPETKVAGTRETI